MYNPDKWHHDFILHLEAVWSVTLSVLPIGYKRFEMPEF